LESIQRPERLARVAYNRLRRAIRDRHLLADTLYSELQIALDLDISRTPVREALIELAREGIVEILPHRGFRVRTMTRDEERELFDLRRLVEAYVVGRLAEARDPKAIDALREIVERQAAAVDDISAFLELDEEFHLTMPALLGLQHASRILSGLRGLIFLGGSAAMASPERAREVIEEHRRIVEALAASDPQQAADSLGRHIERTAALSLERAWIGSQEGSPRTGS
jgi:GntR family transcriptional regulator, rspAB operon transcriptional repressor